MMMAPRTKKCMCLFLLIVILVYTYQNLQWKLYTLPVAAEPSTKTAVEPSTKVDETSEPSKLTVELQKEEWDRININGTVLPPTQKDISVVYQPKDVPVYKTFEEAVKARADEDNLIILSSLDRGYVDMALNLWETSFKKFGIDNYLFVCTDEDAVSILRQKGLPCYLGYQIESSKAQSSYGSAAFKEKTHIKTKIILEALELGYDVLIVDVDIVFLKNPIPFFDCDACDIQIQSDGRDVNSGFYYVRPTNPAVKLHRTSLELAHKSRGLSNQMCINRVLITMRKQHTIKVKVLDSKLFPRGFVFFEQGKRMFSDDPPCTDCVIVHNNWIVGGNAKVYRFKEFGLWMIDNDGYFSSDTTKYMQYNNFMRKSGKDVTRNLEIDTLKVALTIGKILNRKVILPAFHCDGCHYGSCKNPSGRCSLNTFIGIKPFDQNFLDSYREHMFLEHPKVPEAVKDSLSPIYAIKSSDFNKYKNDKWMKNLQVDKAFTPKDPAGATREEIVKWFGNSEMNQYKVLRFHTLYEGFKVSSEHDFEKLLSASLKFASYRQY